MFGIDNLLIKEEIHYILHTIEQNSIETSEAALSVLDMFKKKHLKKTLVHSQIHILILLCT